MRQRRTRGAFLPAVSRSHPTFFIILSIVAFHHLWMAVTQAFAFSRFIRTGVPKHSQSLVEVYGAVPRGVWIAEAAVACLLIVAGMYTRWRLVQAGLAVGLFFTVMRVWLIEIGPAPGGGFGVWIVVIGSHFVQMLEPPSNPLTANRNPITGHDR